MDTTNVTSSQASGSGPTPCAKLGGLTPAQYGQALAPANLSARQANELDLLTSGIYGPHSCGSYRSGCLQSSLVSRLQANLQTTGSTLYQLTWKPWILPSGRRLFRLRASARRISGTGCFGWPTPAATDYKGGYQGGRVRNGKLSTDRLDVCAQLAGWPTPTAALAEKGVRSFTGGLTEALRSKGPDLAAMVCLAGWPTPTCQSPNSLRGNGQDPEKRRAGGHSINLTDAVRYLIQDEPARLTASGVMLTGSAAGMESGGQLNPAHSRWLMGLPPEWCACAPTETRSTRKPR